MENYTTKEIDECGNIEYYNSKQEYHRLDGPAIECTDGSKIWFANGQQHRLDGPAADYANGTKIWCINGKYHRINGPAIEWSDGCKEWYINGKRHRIDGPAIAWKNEYKEWWLCDRIYSVYTHNILVLFSKLESQKVRTNPQGE
jgi:hypothetical protein